MSTGGCSERSDAIGSPLLPVVAERDVAVDVHRRHLPLGVDEARSRQRAQDRALDLLEEIAVNPAGLASRNAYVLTGLGTTRHRLTTG